MTYRGALSEAILLGILTLAVPAFAPEIVRSALQIKCAEILSSFVDQTAPEFSARYVRDGFEIDGKGGFCGPSCIIDAATALSALEGNPLTREQIGRDIELFMERTSHYFSKGTSPESRRQLAERFFDKKGYTAEVSDIDLTTENLNKLANPSRERFFSTVGVSPWPKSSNPQNFSIRQFAHLILITGHRPATKELVYVDPTDPKQERTLRYETVTIDGNPTIAIEAPDLQWINKQTGVKIAPDKKHLFLTGAQTFDLKPKVEKNTLNKLAPAASPVIKGSTLSVPPETVPTEVLAYFDKQSSSGVEIPKQEIAQAYAAAEKLAYQTPLFLEDPLKVIRGLRAMHREEKYRSSKVLPHLLGALDRMIAEGKIAPK